jgi:DNA-binding transcriptional regulator YiaG
MTIAAPAVGSSQEAARISTRQPGRPPAALRGGNSSQGGILAACARPGSPAGVQVISSWTGGQADALRRSLRMTNESFADHLGIGVRTVAYWRKRADVTPQPRMQEVLVTALERAPTALKHSSPSWCARNTTHQPVSRITQSSSLRHLICPKTKLHCGDRRALISMLLILTTKKDSFWPRDSQGVPILA